MSHRFEFDPLMWRSRTWGLTVELFKSHRTDILKRGMSPDPVREAFHILQDGLLGRGPRLEEREINALALEWSEKGLHRGIVPTVSFTADTHRDANIGKQCLIGMAGVLASQVCVMRSEERR